MTRKVVQTELPEEEYALLKKTAKEKNLSIKDGVREAVRQWIETQIPLRGPPLQAKARQNRRKIRLGQPGRGDLRRAPAMKIFLDTH